MNTDFFIQDLVVIRAGDESLREARGRLPAAFPGRSARRMTHLGTLMARVLDGRETGPTLIYGTTYAETRSLEDYVDSFPNPSPLLFQGSIHPSGVQQVFVHRKIPVDTFIPITGGIHLVASVLEAAVLTEDDQVTVCGGEERGTWLLEAEKASAEAFAWAFTLTQSRADASGSLRVIPDDDNDRPVPVDHAQWVTSLEMKTTLAVPRPRGGIYRITWK